MFFHGSVTLAHTVIYGGALGLRGVQCVSRGRRCVFVVSAMLDLPSVCLSIFDILEALHMCQMIDVPT